MLKVAPRSTKGRPKGGFGWIWEQFGHNLGCFSNTFAKILCVILYAAGCQERPVGSLNYHF